MHCKASSSSQCYLQELSAITMLVHVYALRTVSHSIHGMGSGCHKHFQLWTLQVRLLHKDLSTPPACMGYNSQYIKDIYLHNQINTHLVLVLQWQWDILWKGFLLLQQNRTVGPEVIVRWILSIAFYIIMLETVFKHLLRYSLQCSQAPGNSHTRCGSSVLFMVLSGTLACCLSTHTLIV